MTDIGKKNRFKLRNKNSLRRRNITEGNEMSCHDDFLRNIRTRSWTKKHEEKVVVSQSDHLKIKTEKKVLDDFSSLENILL